MGGGDWLAVEGGNDLAGDWWRDGVSLLVNPDGGGQENSLGDVDIVGDDNQLALSVLVRMAVGGVATVRLSRDGGEEDGAECDNGRLHDCGLIERVCDVELGYLGLKL